MKTEEPESAINFEVPLDVERRIRLHGLPPASKIFKPKHDARVWGEKTKELVTPCLTHSLNEDYPDN
ncbi:uncharacterized protein METZ01_LOCUS488339, partial [marine metagenome]